MILYFKINILLLCKNNNHSFYDYEPSDNSIIL